MKASITETANGYTLKLESGQAKDFVRTDKRQAQKEAADLLSQLSFMPEKEVRKSWPEMFEAAS